MDVKRKNSTVLFSVRFTIFVDTKYIFLLIKIITTIAATTTMMTMVIKKK